MDVKTLNELLARGELDREPSQRLIEVKRGRAGPLDFTWFGKVFPTSGLTVVCDGSFQSRQVTGLTIEEFLLSS